MADTPGASVGSTANARQVQGGQNAGGQNASSMVGGIIRMLVVFWLVKSFFGGSKGPPANAPRSDFFWPKFNRSEPVDFFLYTSESGTFSDVLDTSKLIWSEKNIALATNADISNTYVYQPSKAVQNNGSLFLHAYAARHGKPINSRDTSYDSNSVVSKTFQLNTFLPRKKQKQGINLLSGQDSAGEQSTHEKQAELAAVPREYVSYLKPNLTIAFVDDFQRYPAKAIPQQIAEHMSFDVTNMEYYPTIFFNEFWLLRDYLIPINETVTEIPLHFTLSSMTLWKFTLFSQMDQAFSQQQSWGAMGEGESDEFKRVLLEGNPIFLALTCAVSLLHSVFDFFAFKNDIGFWKNKKSVEGLSVRTIALNCFCQLVIFLYLLDSETSYVVLFSSGIGTVIEFWKVTKAMNVTIDRSRGYPMIKFEDKAGYNNASETKRHDADAIRYLSYVLYPLVACYAVYALYYETHKSWYSWILNSLVGAVYTFGFILMCPQLYINYKLKSVAALPWRQMTYKFLNTIIDDLFAFVIKMPWLHRLSVFRDDLVFLVYIYQRYAYRVDKKRPNEFGYAEEAPDEEAEAPQLVPLTPPAAIEGPDASQGKKAVAASEGTPLLAGRIGEKEHQPVGDAAQNAFVDKTEKSTLDGDDFVDLGDNAIIAELEPERTAQHAGEVAQSHDATPSVAEVLDAMKVPAEVKKTN